MTTTLVGHNQPLYQKAQAIRRTALEMGKVQGQGYIAQALDVADVLAVAYFHAMTYRPQDPEWEGRDRFYLSIGHYAIALYAALIEASVIARDEIETMEAMTRRCRCQAWRPIRLAWKSPVAHSARA